MRSLLTILYLVLLGVLLWMTSDEERKKAHYLSSKMAVSTVFIALHIVTWMTTVETDLPLIAMLMPLILCWCGDLAMGVYNLRRKKKAMLIGIIVFLAAHVGFFIYTVMLDVPLHPWDIWVPAVTLFIIAVMSPVWHLHIGRLRPMAYVYSAFIALLLIRGIDTAIVYLWKSVSLATEVGVPVERCFRIGVGWGVGAMLFFASDFLILFLYFYPFRQKRCRTTVHLLNLLTYYLGILLISTAV